MKLSTKSRYSVRLLIDLALWGSGRFVLLKEVAERQGVSEKYLGHLVPLLKNAGFIRTERGAKGGFALIKNPQEISLKDIIEATEGPLALVECLKDPHGCKRSSRCAALDIWGEVTEDIKEVLEKYKLSDLLARQKIKDEGCVPLYIGQGFGF